MNMKETSLYNFYCECEKQGYRNMQDSTESLKAKVIATDLGIKYKDISETYAEAKEVYATEQKRLQKEKLFQKLTGSLLFELHGEEKVSVYLSENGAFYYTKNNDNFKYEGVPSLNLKNGTTLSYTYHPPKATYTGATVGGIHTGGVSYTDAYLTEKSNTTGNGYIDVVAEKLSFTLKFITFSNQIINKFKRDSWVKKTLENGNTIYCYDPSKTKLKIDTLHSGATQAGYYDKISAITSANDIDRLPISECKQILSFLDKILKGQFPPSDEELYSKAIYLENAETSKKLYESIRIFDEIKDYKDSKEHIEKIESKLKPILQREKEQAILEKEATAVKTKRALIIAGIISVVAVITIIIAVSIGKTIETKKEQAATEEFYQTAITYLDDGAYQDAMEAFDLLNGYKDSHDRIVECYNLWFEEGKQLFDEKKYEDSYKCIDSLSNALIGIDFKVITPNMCKAAEDFSYEAFKKMNISQAIQEKNAKYLLKAVENFKLEALSNSKLQKIIVGTWNTISSDKKSLLGKIVFEEDKTWTKYGVDGSVIASGKYSFISNVIDINYAWTQYKFYELEDGYFLMCDNSEKTIAYLIWKN